MSKQLAPDANINQPDPAGNKITNRNNLVSLVEHKFKRMTEEHDRIRHQLLSQSQNLR
ncbi:MAG TPA: hypothetical protein VIT88_01880 [Pyrinomonadaceae bacterium]